VASYQGLPGGNQNFVSVLSTGRVGFQINGELTLQEFSELVSDLGRIVEEQSTTVQDESTERINAAAEEAARELREEECVDNVVKFHSNAQE
jgi:hypothetical protein